MDKYSITGINLITQVTGSAEFDFPPFEKIVICPLEFETEKAKDDLFNELAVKRKNNSNMNKIIYLIVPSYVQVTSITRLER